MHFEIRQNIPAYLADLNHWLAETRDDQFFYGTGIHL